MSLKFIFATDLHLGFKFDHSIRSDDSFAALREVLELCKENDVDFLLIGGDMFDVAHPN